MVRNIVVLGGSSHPELTKNICDHLGLPPASAILSKFSVGETRVEIGESVRGKDVYIIQSGGGKVNDHFMELLIMISACKTASAQKVTAVLPLFPYSRQSDVPYNKTGAPLSKPSSCFRPDFPYTFESKPHTPHPDQPFSAGLSNGTEGLTNRLAKAQLDDANSNPNSPQNGQFSNHVKSTPKRSDTMDSTKSTLSSRQRNTSTSASSMTNGVAHDDNHGSISASTKPPAFEPQPGYKQWVAQAGTLVADLLTCAGADHIITMDLHDPQYQGFFDIPVDNLYGRPLLTKYIQSKIADFKHAVIVSPDAGGAKRATAIADHFEMPFALIHKARTTAAMNFKSLMCHRRDDPPRSQTARTLP